MHQIFFSSQLHLSEVRNTNLGSAKMPPPKKRKLNDSRAEDSSFDSDSASSTRSTREESGQGQVEEEGRGEIAVRSFKDLGVIDSLCEACEALGYKAPTPIQAEAIPLALQGRD